MKKLSLFFILIIFLPFSFFPFYLDFEEIGVYEGNAIYTGIKVVGRYAFLSAGHKGVHIFDVSRPYRPIKISEIESMDQVYSIDVEGLKLYIADGTAGVRIFDIRNKKKPKQISFIPTNHKSIDLKISGNYCYVADEKGGLRIIDIAKPFFPNEISSWDKSDHVNSVAVVHDYVYFVDEKGIMALLISDPDSLETYERISNIELVNKIVTNDRFLFASFQDRGLLVAEVSDVAHPLVQMLPGKYGGIGDIVLSGFYLYIVQGNLIRVLNILVPFNPYLCGDIALSEEISAIHVSGNLLYAACGFDGFKILKISE